MRRKPKAHTRFKQLMVSAAMMAAMASGVHAQSVYPPLVYNQTTGGYRSLPSGGMLNTLPVYTMAAGVNGFVCDGVTNDSAALTSLLTTIYNASPPGGTIIEFGKCGLQGTIAFPNSGGGGGYPVQPPIRITGGQGSGWSPGGSGALPDGGAQLIFTHSTGVAKLDTRGSGTLEIDHLTLVSNDATSGVPFIQTTNTTLKIHDDGFIGAVPNGGANAESAIVLGGCTVCSTFTPGTSATQPFQGYGTAIEHNYFGRIDHIVTVNTYANDVIISENFVGESAGSTDAHSAAILITGGTLASVQQFVTGVKVWGNGIESVGYTNLIYGSATEQSTFIGNNSYDGASSSDHAVAFDSLSTANLVVGGTESGGSYLDPANSGDATTYISTSGNDQNSQFSGITAGAPATPNNLGVTNFTGSNNATVVQPATTQVCANVPFQLQRSAAEGTNPGQRSFGIDYCGGIQVNGTDAGNITNSLSTGASWSANGKTWSAPNQPLMINAGTNGVYFFGGQDRYNDGAGALQAIFSSFAGSGAGIGWDLGSGGDVSLYRISSGKLGTNGSMTATGYIAGSSTGLSCTGTPTSSFATVNGIVTHC